MPTNASSTPQKNLSSDRFNHYIGRFAPTPSGPLHFGSLVAALGSYLDAKAHRGQWLLRIEDIDRSRSKQTFIDTIVKQLEALHLYWDGEISLQSAHLSDFEHALQAISNHLYPCDCSRRQWHPHAKRGALGNVYPGFCRDKPLLSQDPEQAAIRLKMPNKVLCFEDRLLGLQCWHGQKDIGDVIVKRRDKDIAYALAVVVDDAAQGITDVVRGQDLLAATIIQRHLQSLLQLPKLRYLHLPLVLNDYGDKLSKQTHAPAISVDNPKELIYQALAFLGQPVDKTMLDLTLDELLTLATAQWTLSNIGDRPSIAPSASAPAPEPKPEPEPDNHDTH